MEPELKQKGDRHFYCYFDLALQVIGGKWKSMILYCLHRRGTLRFGGLKRHIPTIRETVLTQQLRELEADGRLDRTVYAQVPPRVEYTLTPLGQTLVPIFDQLREWGHAYARQLDPLGEDPGNHC